MHRRAYSPRTHRLVRQPCATRKWPICRLAEPHGLRCKESQDSIVPIGLPDPLLGEAKTQPERSPGELRFLRGKDRQYDLLLGGCPSTQPCEATMRPVRILGGLRKPTQHSTENQYPHLSPWQAKRSRFLCSGPTMRRPCTASAARQRTTRRNNGISTQITSQNFVIAILRARGAGVEGGISQFIYMVYCCFRSCSGLKRI